MEEQIKKLQAELELVKKERDSLILKISKTFVKTRLKNAITNYRKSYVKKLTEDKKNLVEKINEMLKQEEENEI